MKKNIRNLAVIPFLILYLSGCIAALVASVAVVTVDIVHDRRTAGEYIDDNTIELTAQNYLASSKAIRKGAHVRPTSWNGILLMTGEIESPELKQQIVNRLTGITGVRQLVDETTILGKTKLGTRTNDAWITTRVKSRLVLKTGLDANRIKVTTTRGSVYLMGIVTPKEGMKATEVARAVKGVERVVKVFEYQENANSK